MATTKKAPAKKAVAKKETAQKPVKKGCCGGKKK
jgi:hypothetical protein